MAAAFFAVDLAVDDLAADDLAAALFAVDLLAGSGAGRDGASPLKVSHAPEISSSLRTDSVG